MNNESRDLMAHSNSPILSGVETVESIEDLLKKRGFFDTAEIDSQK